MNNLLSWLWAIFGVIMILGFLSLANALGIN